MAKPEGGHAGGARSSGDLDGTAAGDGVSASRQPQASGSGPARELDVEVFDGRLPSRCGHDVVELRGDLLAQLFDRLEYLEA